MEFTNNDSLKINIDNYSGPLEVLLDLAKSQKVDLEKISIENNIKHVKIPQSHSPRASLPSFLYKLVSLSYG